MAFRSLLNLLALGCLVSAIGCHMNLSAGVEKGADEIGEADVSGTLFGTDIEFAAAEYDGQLAITMDGDWAWNPSLLIFLFRDGDGIPAGETIQVSSLAEGFVMNPHVHCRWTNPKTGKLDSEVMMDDYDMTIRFGEVVNGHLPGQFEFSIPGQDTKLSGSFLAVIED